MKIGQLQRDILRLLWKHQSIWQAELPRDACYRLLKRGLVCRIRYPDSHARKFSIQITPQGLLALDRANARRKSRTNSSS